MRKIPVLFCLVLMGVLRVNAQMVNVWPGDANNTFRCNHVDLLQIGQSFGLSGPPRNNIDSTWNPFPAQPWVGQPAMINAVHSDCNGDGVVDRMDALIIERNFNEFVGGLLVADDSSSNVLGAPLVGINLIQDTINVQGVTMLTLSIELGNQANPVDSIYGLALTIHYDPQIVDDVSLNWTGGFMADTTGNSLLFARADTVTGDIYLAVTALDHSNRMGYGTLGTIGIVMDDNIRITGEWDLIFEPVFVLGLTSSGLKLGLQPRSDTLTVITGMPSPRLAGIDVFPNPTTGQFAVRSAKTMLNALVLRDAQGRVVARKQQLNSLFEIFSTDQLSPGCYLLEVHTENGILRKKLIIESN
ncbi:MAG TPA: T9SS type A sorting domain-containing protein [Bacteroidia bacterium]|nr:T9SS type A sorting domain-containing protein [Bacteroidia bacterium]